MLQELKEDLLAPAGSHEVYATEDQGVVSNKPDTKDDVSENKDDNGCVEKSELDLMFEGIMTSKTEIHA